MFQYIKNITNVRESIIYTSHTLQYKDHLEIRDTVNI